MNEHATPPLPPNRSDHAQAEARLTAASRGLPYPPTPDITSRVRRRLAARTPSPRRWLAVAALILALLLSLLAVPQVRAAVGEFFIRIGVILISTGQPTAIPSLTGTPVATAASSPTPLQTIMDLAGVTTLERAIKRTPFTLKMPAYPANLAQPDGVFLQDLGGTVVVFVWLGADGKPELSVHQLGPAAEPYAMKGDVTVLQKVTVNGQPGMWMEGAHVLQFLRGNLIDFEIRRLVEGHVLVWSENNVTYRIETGLPLEEALKIAGSLQPLN